MCKLKFTSARCLLLPVLFLFSIALSAQNYSTVSFATYKTDLAYNCIAVDSNNNIWAGTNGKGLWKFQYFINNYVAHNFSGYNNSFDRVNITGVASTKTGVWVAQQGFNGATATYGGLDFVDLFNGANRTHYTSVSLISNNNNKGFPSRRAQFVAMDKNGTAWTSHNYHDLTVIGGNPQYIVNPGGVGFKKPGASVFDTVKTILPYPAYTVNTPANQTAGTRVCTGLGVDNKNGEVWTGVASYNIGSVNQGSRIAQFDLDGNFIGQIDETNSPLPLGNANGNTRTIGICFDTARNNVWVSFNLAKGIAIRNNTGTWNVIGNLAGVLPAGTQFNQNAITVNAAGDVFFGTTAGLLIYKHGSAFDASGFVLITTNQGLPSNNVTGVAIDKGGNPWVSTSVGIAKMTSSAFSVYNLSHPVPGKEMDASRYQIICANEFDRECDGAPLNLHVAADSSEVTMIVYTGPNPQQKNVRITGASVANAYYTSEFGHLREIKRTTDSLVYMYRHPSFVYNGTDEKKVSYPFLLKDSITLENVIEGKLSIHHSPVLMIHGIWSSVQAFEKMNRLIRDSSGNFEDHQLLRIWYGAPQHDEPLNSASFYSNQVPQGIDGLLTQCRTNKLSAGKVNIIGHSRGGMYARYYLQSVYTPYRNDINKIISLNTPHAGSQQASLILDQRTILPGLKVGALFRKFVLEEYDSAAGATQLKINDESITDKLNGPLHLNKNKVAVHAVYTKYAFGAFSKADIYKVVAVNGLTRIPVAGRFVAYLRLYMLALGSFCLEGPIDNCLKEMFNGEDNDIVVPLSSQKGGLPAFATSFFADKVAHSNKQVVLPVINDTILNAKSVVETDGVITRVMELLRDNPNSSTTSFTRDGYHPPTNLEYKFLPNLPGNSGRINAEGITIDPALRNQNFVFGDTVQVTVTGSAGINKILMMYDGANMNEAYSDYEAAGTFTFPLPIPRNAVGRLLITAVGANADGLAAIDSSYINIGIRNDITLDSIRIVSYDKNVIIPKREQRVINVLGYYSDTVRTITYQPGFSGSLLENNISYGNAKITGLNIGYDRLILNFQGFSDTAYVQVTDTLALVVLPVNFLSFTGRLQDDYVALKWSTLSERNNDFFDIERSSNGVDFRKIGTVRGNGTTGAANNYHFNDPQFTTGANYYRLRQVDLDGRFNYSRTVLVLIDKQGILTIFPNPASHKITIQRDQPFIKPVTRLYNQMGQVVHQQQHSSGLFKLEIPVASLAKGMYMLEVIDQSGERVWSGKIIKE